MLMLDCILILKAPFVGGMAGIIIDDLNKRLNFLLFLYFLNSSVFSAIILNVCKTLNCIDSKICIFFFFAGTFTDCKTLKSRSFRVKPLPVYVQTSKPQH